MGAFRRAVTAIAALVAVAGCDPVASSGGEAQRDDVPMGSGFDFYVLSLSWSPGYCASAGDRANREQCGGDPDHGFTVHGLWPQYERGWPEFCDSQYPRSVDMGTVRTISDLIPSTGLARHEWQKHGTCSGLSQIDYFKVTRAAYERVAIPREWQRRAAISTVDPDDVESAFRRANPDLPADAIAVTCDRRFLRDVRICLSVDLDSFVACPEVDRRSCALDGAVAPPT